jgi:S1-C subfamily serine protease
LGTSLSPTLRVLSGSRSGFVFAPAARSFTVGRNVDSDLRFSPHLDLSVSGRHAEFFERDGHWYVSDVGSSNGTWLNGECISGPALLTDGDTIAFGVDGPAVRFELAMVARRAGSATGGATADTAVRESTTQRLRAAVRRETHRLRLGAAVLITLIVMAAAALVIADRRDRSVLQSDHRTLQLRIDSLLAAGRAAESSLTSEMSGLRAALQESETRLRTLRGQLDVAAMNDADVADLQRQLFTASTALRRQQLAASLDFALIERRNRAAVAIVWIEYDDGSVASGTAFAVRADGTMLTNRHLVAGPAGARTPARIAVRFAGSSQTFPARLLALSTGWDLAALRVENIVGAIPTVGPLRTEPPAPGEAIALIGYPLAGEAVDAAPRVAVPLTSAGVILDGDTGLIEMQGLGAAGGSGSPVLDGTGNVVGILFGGRRGTDFQVLLAVPAAAAASFLAGVP